jgi:hypothetical protein
MEAAATSLSGSSTFSVLSLSLSTLHIFAQAGLEDVLRPSHLESQNSATSIVGAAHSAELVKPEIHDPAYGRPGLPESRREFFQL